MIGGIVILCRYSSSRLPGKILKEIAGQPILYHIYQRLSSAFPSEQLVVATSEEASDDPIAEFCERHQINCFRGSLNHVAQRFYEAAAARNWEYAVRINGDNLFIDTNTLETMMDQFQAGGYDFVSNVPGRTFPYGMSIEIVGVPFFKEILAKIQELRHQEHVTLYLYDHETVGKRHYVVNEEVQTLQGAKFAIDEQKDFDFATKLMTSLGDRKYTYNLEDLARLVEGINS